PLPPLSLNRLSSWRADVSQQHGVAGISFQLQKGMSFLTLKPWMRRNAIDEDGRLWYEAGRRPLPCLLDQVRRSQVDPVWRPYLRSDQRLWSLLRLQPPERRPRRGRGRPWRIGPCLPLRRLGRLPLLPQVAREGEWLYILRPRRSGRDGVV
ncbi:unnamed protein product, partial [Prunus brigantina]